MTTVDFLLPPLSKLNFQIHTDAVKALMRYSSSRIPLRNASQFLNAKNGVGHHVNKLPMLY